MKGKAEVPRKKTVGVIRSMYCRNICSHKLFKKYSNNYNMLISVAESESSPQVLDFAAK